ncbi:hypothetical protein RclHR1_02280022 [Rhizophagus clarus]|uniref:F-box domain-containing protein n=1 Tax=Rhizophagus clarus TaxID=94130 RepID=A0A2Z6R8H0_9GLOM|nr:hypothetical protein RclHR1_02280022 [Rhizophagus clarus]GES75742.1 hypothetical protein GLOIN_2v1876052 [Rhizophagus clarus]
MNSQTLTYDCYYNIFENFLYNDRSTLFACLLVTKVWCDMIFRLLYENPFEILKNKNYLIISTLKKFLNEGEITRLQKFSRKRITIRKPLYNYPEYIKVFDQKNIRKAIIGWLCIKKIELNDETKDNIVTLFHHMLLRQCKNIRQMNISSTSLIRDIFNNRFIEKNIINLSNLKSIQFDFGGDLSNSTFLEFLRKFSNICLSLEYLQINIDKYNSVPPPTEEICSIIKKQRNLKRFKISNDESRTHTFRTANPQNNLLDDIFLSLKDSLVSLDFVYINFKGVSFRKFKDLSNLKYLKFHNCKKITLENCEDLKSFKLRELSIQSPKLKSEVKILMIRYFGGSLHRLIIDKPTIPIIEEMLSCSHLETLDVKIGSNVTLEVLEQFKRLNIKNLNLSSSSDCKDCVFKNLAKNLPLSVKVVTIRYPRSHNTKQFLDNVHCYLTTINLQNKIKFDPILDYIERSNNQLKRLGVATLENNKSNILKRIEDKGVKVVDFNSIYRESDYE